MSQHDHETAVEQATTSQARLVALNSLSEELCDVSPDRALELAMEAYRLAVSLDDSENALIALLNRAWAQYNLADYRDSIMSVQEALQEARNGHLEKQEFDALTILGHNYNVIGNWADALHCFTQALVLSKKLNNLRKVATTLSNIGQQYGQSNKHQQALEHYLQGLAILRDLNMSLPMLVHVLLNVSETYDHLGDYWKALTYSSEGLETSEKANYKTGQALALLFTGNVYQHMGAGDTAMTYYNQALRHIHEANAPLYEGEIQKNMAVILLAKGNTAQALAYLQDAQTIFQALGAKPELFEVHYQLAQIYRQMGDFGKAFDQFALFHRVKEEVFNEQADKRQKVLQALYEVEQARLEAETQYNRILMLQAEIQQSEQLIMELDAYADNVAHDLRNPIGVIVGFGGLLEMNLSRTLDAESQSYLDNMLAAADKMNDIIESLLTLARARREEILPQVVHMDTVLDEALKRLQPLIAQQNAVIKRSASLPAAMGNAAWLEDAFVNYISNGIKYGGKPPRLVIGATSQDDGFVRYWVQDNGPGLNAEDTHLLFQKFERLGQQKIDGYGLGLTIVKTIAEKLGGTVQVESSGIPGNGCTFSFTLRLPTEDL